MEEIYRKKFWKNQTYFSIFSSFFAEIFNFFSTIFFEISFKTRIKRYFSVKLQRFGKCKQSAKSTSNLNFFLHLSAKFTSVKRLWRYAVIGIQFMSEATAPKATEIASLILLASAKANRGEIVSGWNFSRVRLYRVDWHVTIVPSLLLYFPVNNRVQE